MIDRKELELLVRAQIQGGKDLDGVAKSISKIGDAIDEQTEAAKRGESRIDELKGSLEALGLIQKELAGQNSAITYFNKLTESIGKSEARLQKATERYDAYKKKLDEAGERTEKQQQTLIKYSLAVEKAEKALASQRDTLGSVTNEFKAAGMAVENLAAVQQRNLQLQAELGLVYQRGKESVKGYAEEVRKARQAQAELDRANAESAKAAQQFEQAQRRATEAAQARAKAAQEVEQARSNRSAEVAANALADREARDQAQRAAELAQKRRDVERAFADDALAKEAQAARQTAQSYTTLARAATDLKPKVVSLREAVTSVLDPSTKVTATLNGLEREVLDLASSVSKINGPVSNYREQVDRLAQAQRALSSQSGLVDSYNKQLAALRSARAAFTEARAEVTRYAAEVAKGGDAGAQFSAKLAQAQNQLRGSAQALAQQVAATRASREALLNAGISTNNLADAQKRLYSAAQSTVSSLKGLEEGVRKYGQATDEARRSQGLFRDEGRTTLSYFQRLRGEVLSLVAAYGGLFTVINAAQGAIRATNQREGARNQLSISVGNDRAAIDAEYEYVKAQSDRIGIEFDRAIKGYAKFSAAATLAGRSRQEIRYIYETFAEVGRVANLSADDLDGVFKALEQITSKGKIQAEELRGQLGDRLFGAFEIAAKALKDQYPDLDKALQNGQVSAKQLVAIAEQYRKTVADQLPAATQSLAAQQARLNNAVFDFQLAIADSGFIKTYTEALRKLTEFLRSDDGKNAATTFGKLFDVLTKGFIFLLDNLDEIVLGIKLFLTYFAYTRFASGIKALGTVGSLLTGLKTGFAAAGAGLSTLQKGFAVFFAFIAGFEFGSYLYEEFQIVRDAGTWLVTRLMEAWAIVKASYMAAIEALPVFTKEVFQNIVNLIKRAAKGLTGIFADIAEAVGLDGVGAALRKVEKSIDGAFAGFGKSQAVVQGFRENLKKELAEIDRIRQEMLLDNGGAPKPKAKPNATPTPSPGTSGGGGKTGPSEAEIKKRQNEIEAITRALETLEAKIDRSETETLARQIEAIDTQYAALARRIEKLGGDTGKQFMERLTASVKELREQTIKKFNADLLKEEQALQKKVGDLEEQTNKRAKLDLDKRLSAIVDNYGQVYAELEQLQAKFVANGRDTSELQAARQRLDVAKAQALEQEKIKFNTEELQRREALVNDTISARDKLLAAVRQQQEVGNIDDVQAAEQLNAIQAEYVPKIEAAAIAAKEWAIANAAIFANPEQQAVFLATLDAIRARAVGVKTEFSMMNQQIIQGGVNAVNNGLNLIADGLQNVATGQMSIKDGFMGMLAGFAQFAAAFLRDIALMIIKMQIFRALQGQGGILGAIGTAGLKSMGVMHSGGIVGETRNRTRDVSPLWFAGAPRYHSGGLSGLAADEYPAILQKGEEVLAKDSPRNILNGGAGLTGGNNGGAQGVRVVLVDDRAKVPEAMNSPDGEKVFMQFARRNVATLKQILK